MLDLAWRAVGEASNLGLVQTRSARRLAAVGGWDEESVRNQSDSPSGALAVAEPVQTSGECSSWAVRADCVRRDSGRIGGSPDHSSFHHDDASIVPASSAAV